MRDGKDSVNMKENAVMMDGWMDGWTYGFSQYVQ